jgi:hypothetical membrane protein
LHAPHADLSSSDASGPRWQLEVGAVCWILTVVFFVGQLVAQLAWPGFSLLDNRVSDLGSTVCGPWLAGIYVCSPLHAVMNAALVASGVLMLLGLYFTRRAWPKRRLTAWGLGLLTVAGLCTIVVGLNPENENLRFHLVGALNIPAANTALLLLGLAAWGTRHRVAWLSIALGVLGWLGLPLGILLLVVGGHGGGLAERVALYPSFIWTIVLGVAFLRSSGRTAGRFGDADRGRASPTGAAL